jgi:ubiquitin-like 1-activating enzyme E1 A
MTRVCHAAVLAAFEEANGRQATPADVAGLQQQAVQLEEADGVKVGTVRTELLQDLVTDKEEFAPACAVLGGIIANNVIKSISSTGEPVFNMVLYSVADGLGAVEQMT